MIARNPYSNCIDARVYYYDFLREETRDGIPQSTLEHITQCEDCQSEIDRLKNIFENANRPINPAQSRKNAAIGTLLRLHFDYIDKPVTCETVKPFLPPLADPALQISVPTPITAHIDKCQACRDDLATLRDLHLSHKQLCRLSQLLADDSNEHAVSCSRAQAAIPSVVSMTLSETNADTLKHLCVCTECRDNLSQYRESICEKLQKKDTKTAVPCETVSASDIYDYCMPYGLDPANDQYAGFRESLTSHLRSCPTCMSRIQNLHKTLCGIAERPASDITTIYHIAEQPVEDWSDAEFEGSYAGFPVKVELAPAADLTKMEITEIINSTARPKRKTSALAARPLFRTGALAAAAMLLVGLSLLLRSTTATAVTYDEIRKAVEGVRNVHVTSLSARAGLIEEVLISKPLNLYILKDKEELVLSDIGKKVRKVKNLNGGPISETPLSDEFCTAIRDKIKGSLGLLPFGRISDVPAGTNWSRVPDDSPEIAGKNLEVYDLTYQAPGSSGSDVFSKARFFVDSQTGFPTKVEFYRKRLIDSEYVLQTQLIVERLSDDEFHAFLNAASL